MAKMRTTAGFIFSKNRLCLRTMRFTKPPKTPAELATLLISRGLHIPDIERAKRYLGFIGYYRLSGFCYHLYSDKDTKTFAPGATFDTILKLYIFDRHLRLLVMDAVERIEIAVRASITNTFCAKYGSHWYTDSSMFKPTRFDHVKLIDLVKRETAYRKDIDGTLPYKHYYFKYREPDLPPTWMVADVLSLGTWSRMYKFFLDIKSKKDIAKIFDLSPYVMESWLHSLTYLRNLCAHHSRIWDKVFNFGPERIGRLSTFFSYSNPKFFSFAVILNDLLRSITNNPTWANRLYTLLENDCPLDYKVHMGFPIDWQLEPFWQISPPAPDIPLAHTQVQRRALAQRKIYRKILGPPR